MKSLQTATISSPCNGVCQLDGEAICLGCFRHRDEITRWIQMEDREKVAVNLAVAERKMFASLVNPAMV